MCLTVLNMFNANLYLLQEIREFDDIHMLKCDSQVDIIIARDPEKEPVAPAAPVIIHSYKHFSTLEKVERRKRRKLPMIERPRSAPIYAGEQLPYSSHIRWGAPSPIYSHPLHHLLNLHQLLLNGLCSLFPVCIKTHDHPPPNAATDLLNLNLQLIPFLHQLLSVVFVLCVHASPSGQVDFRKLSGCLSNVHDVCDFSHQDGSMKTVIRCKVSIMKMQVMVMVIIRMFRTMVMI